MSCRHVDGISRSWGWDNGALGWDKEIPHSFWPIIMSDKWMWKHCSSQTPQQRWLPVSATSRISTQMHFRPPLLIQVFISVASSHRLSGILWSHLLKMQRIVLLNSLLWCEQSQVLVNDCRFGVSPVIYPDSDPVTSAWEVVTVSRCGP